MRSLFSVTFTWMSKFSIQTTSAYPIAETKHGAVASVGRAFGTSITPISCIRLKSMPRPVHDDRMLEAIDLLNEQLNLRCLPRLGEDAERRLSIPYKWAETLEFLRSTYRIDVCEASALLGEYFAWRAA